MRLFGLNENETLTLVVAAAGALIALVTAGISYSQLRVSIRQSRHQATFEHLGRVRKLLREISGIDPAAARTEALAFYTGEATELSKTAQDYLNLLDEWDLLGVAYKHKLVNRKMVLEALRNTLRNPHTVGSDFIAKVKEAQKNTGVYQDLEYLIGCCARQTFRERLTAVRRVFHGRSKAAEPLASTPGTGIAEVGADSGGGNAGLPPPAVGTAEAGTPVSLDPPTALNDTDVIPEPKQSNTTPPPVPPSPPSDDERGETPGVPAPAPAPTPKQT